jgi:hypothetical protein
VQVSIGARVRCVLAACALLSGLAAAQAGAETIPFWDAQVSSPLRLSAGLGLVVGRRGEGFATARNALLLQVEPGIGGGALHVGWVPFSGTASGLQFAGVALKGTLLRTWGSPVGVDASRTFAGASIHAAWIVKLSVGVLAPIDGGGGGAVVTWGVGVGL